MRRGLRQAKRATQKVLKSGRKLRQHAPAMSLGEVCDLQLTQQKSSPSGSRLVSRSS